MVPLDFCSGLFSKTGAGLFDRQRQFGSGLFSIAELKVALLVQRLCLVFGDACYGARWQEYRLPDPHLDRGRGGGRGVAGSHAVVLQRGCFPGCLVAFEHFLSIDDPATKVSRLICAHGTLAIVGCGLF
jgi:hypothetical protein